VEFAADDAGNSTRSSRKTAEEEVSVTDQGIVPPGGGHLLTARGSVMAFKAVAAQTGGDFSLMERTVPPGGRRPPAHRHVNCSEAFFVLDGQVTFSLDGTDLSGGPGDFLLVPRGAGHTFGNGGTGPARLLVLHAPAMDAYFEELHRLWASGQPPATEDERALMARYGMEPA
jgi:mannose-6-phosphate isomerase-like protein (cupin superfamily)